MLKWTTAGERPLLGLILHHDDGESESACDHESGVGRWNRGLAEAARRGGQVVCMKGRRLVLRPHRVSGGEPPHWPGCAPCHNLRKSAGRGVAVDPFEFLIGLYTIIVGLGISLLVRSVGQMIDARERIRFYWVHNAWLVLVFIAHVGSWFALWQYHGLRSWTALECMMLLLVPILLYLVSHLAVPEIDELGDERHDMRGFYYGYYRLIQGLLAATLLVQTANEVLIMDSFAATPAQLVRFAILAMLVPGLVSARPSVHSAQVVVLMALALMGSAYFGYRIQ